MITVICKLKSKIVTDIETGEISKTICTMGDVSREVWEAFGKGGYKNPGEIQQVEDLVGWVCTPPQNGYTRILIDDYYATALEQYKAAFGEDAFITCELISVEWDGQGDFEAGSITLEDGTVQPLLLGVIDGVPMKVVEVAVNEG